MLTHCIIFLNAYVNVLIMHH